MVRGLTVWSREDLAGLVDYPANQMPVIAPGTVEKLVPGIDLWDIWPFRLRDGSLAEVGGRQIWAALSAPAVGDPGGRHDVARIRMISTDGAAWSDHGNLFPDGASLGSREWAGSCVVRGDRVQAYYTAAGRRGESSPTFGQRIAGAAGRLVGEGETLGVADWEEHRQVLVSDGERYHRADEAEGEPGFIKAFRDPFPFTDPATGHDHLLFTASEADATTDFNGAIGIARRGQGGWELLDPLVTADGVNNELERPHVVCQDGYYYLFFSTQRRTFHPDVTGPTGLYGFVGEGIFGPFRPLNGSGLVVANPFAEPFQAYSWLVLNDLRVVSFVDSYGLGGVHPDEYGATGDVGSLRRHFGGTMAPVCRLYLERDRAGLAV